MRGAIFFGLCPPIDHKIACAAWGRGSRQNDQKLWLAIGRHHLDRATGEPKGPKASMHGLAGPNDEGIGGVRKRIHRQVSIISDPVSINSHLFLPL